MLTKERLMEITIELLDNNDFVDISDEKYVVEAKYACAFNDGVMELYKRIKEELGGLG